MGLFDKIKKKSNEEKTPAVTPEVTADAETQGVSEGAIIQDNVFNATPGELTMPPMQDAPQTAPVQDMQIQNTAESVSVDSPAAIINETAATIDEPSAALEQQSAISVNPIAMFEDDQNKEDAITQMVSAAVNKEETDGQNVTSEPVENPIQTESILEENQVGTIGETVVGPTMENSIYESAPTPEVIEQVSVEPAPAIQNDVIEDIISTEEVFIPDEIAESQKEVFELTKEPKIEELSEPVLELSDLSTADMIITSNAENENNTINEEINELVENNEMITEQISEQPVITDQVQENVEPVITMENPEIAPIIEETSNIEINPVIEENNEIVIEQPVIAEELSALNFDEPKVEEPTLEVVEEQPMIEEEIISPVVDPIITEEETPIEIEQGNEETTPVIEETPSEELQADNSLVEETTTEEEIAPIIENNVQDLILGEEITSLDTEISDNNEEPSEIEEPKPIIEEETPEITAEEDSQPIIEEEKNELFLGEENEEGETVIPIIPEITDLAIPKPIEEISEYMLDAATDENEETATEVSESNEGVVAGIYGDVTTSEETTEDVSIEPSAETTEEKEVEEPVVEIEPENEESTTVVEEDEPVVLPFDITFPHFDAAEDINEPTMVEAAEPNVIYISEAPNTKFCDSCGNIITEDTSICPSCGEPID